MNTKNDYSSMLLHIELFGHGYSSDVGDEVRKALTDAPNRLVRGEWLPAFAPWIVMEFVIDVIQEVPREMLVAFIICSVKKAYDTVKRRIGDLHENALRIYSVKVATPLYDIVFYGNPLSANLAMDRTVRKMESLVKSEAQKGRRVARISFPVTQAINGSYLCERNQDDPNYFLWVVEYEESATLEPVVYDEANSCFLEGVELKINSVLTF